MQENALPAYLISSIYVYIPATFMNYFEFLADFISRNALFLQQYGNWLLVPLIAGIFLLSRWVQKQKRWSKFLRGAFWVMLFIINFSAGSVLYMINWPLRPMVNSLAKAQRNIGKHMSDFSFVLLGEHAPRTLTDYRGKIIVLNFWATYCGGCIEEFPDLQKLEAEHADELVVIALSDEDPQKLARVVPRLHAPAKTGYYSNQEWMNLESFRPVTLILDREGVIREYKWGRHTFVELEAMVSEYR